MEICMSRCFALPAAFSVAVLIGHGPLRLLPAVRSADHVTPRLRACASTSQSESATRVIGPAGGAIRFADHVLEIPAGALDSAVSITATAAQSPYVVVDLAPHGLQFRVPAHLSMGYGACAWADSLFHIDYLSDDLTQVLEQESSTVHPDRHMVEAPIDHFSLYAVAEGALVLPGVDVQISVH
jgi:hypothetical protein